MPGLIKSYRPNVNGLYGAESVAASYCSLSSPLPAMRGYWEHGWTPAHMLFHPDATMGFPTSELKSGYFWLGREDEVCYLRTQGYPNAQAIGLPIVYAEDKTIERLSKSLLVMPVHSISLSKHSWDFERYVSEITGIRHLFSEVVVSVHPSCWEKGNWVKEFQKQGFRVIKGLTQGSLPGIQSIRDVLSRFEFVTANGFGSNLAYAAYCGAKVSIFGSYCEYRKEDFEDVQFYSENPSALEPTLAAYSEDTVRREYPHLFVHPTDAQKAIDWGRYEVGFAHRVTPNKMKGLFGWQAYRRRASQVWESSPERIKHLCRIALRPKYRARNKEVQRLRRLPRYTRTVTNLLGKPFEISDRDSFLSSYLDIFEKQVYKFHTGKRSPFVIDCGSNIGLSVAYFKALYPESRVIAFEPDPELFSLLKKNCRSLNVTGIEFIPKAVWSSETTLRFMQEGGEGGRLVVPGDEERIIEVPTARLRDFLTEDIDLLKVDVEGAETEVLRDCAERLDRVRRLFVEYHSFANSRQTLDELVSILSRAGFRLHMHTPRPSPQPFEGRVIDSGMDFQANIFAFRD